ncbi:DUF6220 domain-containing protein [Alkalihalobacillus hemicellulosilyticus]|nr:DUF6220 domain-containing protein [Halalkalibacter hemicellulosilyticus]
MTTQKLVPLFRACLGIISWIFTLCIIIQVLLTGFALFVNPINWSYHVIFARFFFFLPLIMALLAYFAQLPKKIIWKSIGLFGIVIALFFTAIISARFSMVGALHPIIALFLFWNCVKLLPPYKEY